MITSNINAKAWLLPSPLAIIQQSLMTQKAWTLLTDYLATKKK
jgi:hypothetical protein